MVVIQVLSLVVTHSDWTLILYHLRERSCQNSSTVSEVSKILSKD